jgi:hypothetical protein
LPDRGTHPQSKTVFLPDGRDPDFDVILRNAWKIFYETITVDKVNSVIMQMFSDL